MIVTVTKLGVGFKLSKTVVSELHDPYWEANAFSDHQEAWTHVGTAGDSQECWCNGTL